MVNKISELSVRDLPEHIKENINDLIRSFSDMDGLIQVFWIQYGLKNVMNYSVVSLKPSYAVRYEESFPYYQNPYYQNKKATSSGTRYFYQGDSDWSKLDSLYKELMRGEKLNKLGI
jgi:hypothetical protein